MEPAIKRDPFVMSMIWSRRLIRLMNTPDLHDPVNLGNPGEFTIKELAAEVMKCLRVEVGPEIPAASSG